MRTIPSVRRGQPEAYEANEYQEMKIGGATVYVHSSLNGFPDVQIDTDGGFFASGKLVLKGIEEQNKGGCCG